jgi:DNA polymerase-3 subunit alpha
MKAHYPVEFLAASMTLDMGNTDKLSEFRSEAQRLGIKIDPPSINRSDVQFEVSDNTIHYALAALKGVGAQAVEMVVETRGEKPFTGFSDFAARINPRAVNKRVIESLAAAGAFDEFEHNRARAFAGAERILAEAQRAHEGATIGQNELFGGLTVDTAALTLPAVEPWLPAERLQKEYDAIGFFLSGHPLDDYGPALKRLKAQSWAEFCRAIRSGTTAGRVGATVISRQERRTKTGNKMGIIGLSDPSGQFESVLFSEGLAQFRDMLEPGRAVLLQLGAELQGEEVRARIHNVEALDEAAAKTQMALRIFLRDDKPIDSIAKRLETVAVRAGPGANGGSGKAADVTLIMPIDQENQVENQLQGRLKH